MIPWKSSAIRRGGIIAAAAATDFQDKYDIQHIATLGSPIANFEIPEKTRVTAIEMDDEGIAALDGGGQPPYGELAHHTMLRP